MDASDAVLEPDDASLARQVAARGAPAATAEAELCRRLAPRIRLYGLRHLRSPEAAADLVQQVLMTTLERLRAGEVREPGRIASFVLGMSRMVCIDLRRIDARRERLLQAWAQDLAGAVAEAPAAVDDQRLAGCMGRLSERERSVLVLTFYDDRGAGEVGAELGLSEANVRVIRHRGLQRLRACMDAVESAP